MPRPEKSIAPIQRPSYKQSPTNGRDFTRSRINTVVPKTPFLTENGVGFSEEESGRKRGIVSSTAQVLLQTLIPPPVLSILLLESVDVGFVIDLIS